MTLECRLCNGQLLGKPILILNSMPRAAQFFPEEEDFDSDHGIDLKVYQCRDCGLVQLCQEPVPYHKEVITAATLSGSARQFRLQEMSAFVNDYSLSGKSILEVGAGKGEMLEVIEEAGAVATGLEASEASVTEGIAAGRNLVMGYVGDQELGLPHDYSGFVSFNYLEHVPDPCQAIRRIFDYTSNDAVGLVTVPNLEFLLEEKCYYEFVADHLSYFTEKTLATAFDTLGFETIESKLINNRNDIQVVVRKKSYFDLSENYKEVEQLCLRLRNLTQGHVDEKKRVAVWGAGHRTLALLALSDVEGIEYVVDSAKFKQGKFTPTLHIEIVPPERLVSDPVDLVIVMVPGIYPDEVVNAIDNMNINVNVAIHRGNDLEMM